MTASFARRPGPWTAPSAASTSILLVVKKGNIVCKDSIGYMGDYVPIGIGVVQGLYGIMWALCTDYIGLIWDF